MRTASFDKLCQQVATLKQHAEQFDKAKLFAKNRYMQAQPSLFDRGVFTTKSMKLVDYVLEIEDEVNSLPPLERRHAHNYALERIVIRCKPYLTSLNQPLFGKKKTKALTNPVVKPIINRHLTNKL